MHAAAGAASGGAQRGAHTDPAYSTLRPSGSKGSGRPSATSANVLPGDLGAAALGVPGLQPGGRVKWHRR